MTRAKLAKRFAVHLIARFAAALLCLVPLRLALAIGALVGRIAFVLATNDRARAITQIGEALALDRSAARELAKRVFENAGRLAAEIALLPRIRRRFRAYVDLSAPAKAVLEEALSEKKGVLFVSAHLGSFELLAQRIAHEGYACVTLARKSSNPFLAGWLIARRAAGKVETINRGDRTAARRVLAALKKGAILGALIDQDTKVESVFVPFFGRPAATPVAPIELALRRELPVVFGTIRRKPSGGHAIHLERVSFASADPTAAAADLTSRIESAIRAAPEEWVWFHARWKTPPPDPAARAPSEEHGLRSEAS
jgi:Kdo2-lipid IVA lauroyltransferase/acyltransferase